jgi:hypothetical protein
MPLEMQGRHVVALAFVIGPGFSPDTNRNNECGL